ncbi:MAG: 4-hydroxy-tetrahydrodipicolinate reductase [Candidatus Omnitrophica bacterium CG1_02_49_10]|nr:MAG: 4-hydroxy-tetrahydrodipicolinate reductase [Candidatus Omnitrophica bacterium CG1_02_49_10]
MIKIAVSGCSGRMGKRIVYLASVNKEFKVVGALEHKGHPSIGKDAGIEAGSERLGVNITDDAALAIKDADVIIEFTTPDATKANLKAAYSSGKAMVIGTTGIEYSDIVAMEEAAYKIPIVFSPNMGVGINLLFSVVTDAAKSLGAGYKAHITEAHHKHKKDAPSGTAKKFAELVSSAGNAGINDIPIESVREGEIVGEHTIVFDNGEEQISFTHKAHTRDTFASGALRAAQFIAGKAPGLYSMQDVLK